MMPVFANRSAAFRPAKVAAFGVLLSACAVGPDYTPPAAPLPAHYASVRPVARVGADYAEWWRAFHDPLLDRLIAIGQAGNIGLAEAAARVREAEALARAAGYPVTGGLSLTQQSSAGTDTAELGASAGFDLFGAQRRRAEGAFARLQATQFGARNARLQLLAAIAQTYIDIRFYQTTLDELAADLASRTKTMQLIVDRAAVGESTRLDRLGAEALVEETRARIPLAQSSLAAQYARMATLLGTTLAEMPVAFGSHGRQPVATGAVAAGVPADLLRLRPDIRQAERSYAAAVADVGVAEAARYPSLSLSGTLTVALNGGGTARGLTSGLSVPLFDQPALAAQANAAEARAAQSYLAWRGAVLTAVQDVEIALSAIYGTQRSIASSRKVLSLYTEVLGLSREQLGSGGDVTVLDLLDHERQISAARSTLAQGLRDVASYTVQLYLALGIGPEEPGGTPG